MWSETGECPPRNSNDFVATSNESVVCSPAHPRSRPPPSSPRAPFHSLAPLPQAFVQGITVAGLKILPQTHSAKFTVQARPADGVEEVRRMVPFAVENGVLHLRNANFGLADAWALDISD